MPGCSAWQTLLAVAAAAAPQPCCRVHLHSCTQENNRIEMEYMHAWHHTQLEVFKRGGNLLFRLRYPGGAGGRLTAPSAPRLWRKSEGLPPAPHALYGHFLQATMLSEHPWLGYGSTVCSATSSGVDS